MTQYLVPIADLFGDFTGAFPTVWFGSYTDGSNQITTNLYTYLAEATGANPTPAGDLKEILTVNNLGGGTAVYVTQLSAGTVPPGTPRLVLNYSASSEINAGLTWTVEVRQGYVNESSKGTLLGSWNDTTPVLATGLNPSIFSHTLTNAPSDYSTLSVRFVLVTNDGLSRVHVEWVQLVVDSIPKPSVGVTFKPIYRATIYAHRSVDPTETTVLHPKAGAAHNDPFQIASTENLSGYKPYMGMPSGRHGRVDPLSKKTDTGEISFAVFDPKAGAITDNLTRWFTAFFGDSSALNQLADCKAFVEENLGTVPGLGSALTWTANSTTGWTANSEAGKRVDFYSGTTLIASDTVVSNTSTALTLTAANPSAAAYALVWNPYFTGRVGYVTLAKRVSFTIRVRDESWRLKGNVFTAAPHPTASYAQPISLLPVGVINAYGAATPTKRLTATMSKVDTVSNTGSVNPTNASLNRIDNVIQGSLAAGVNPQYLNELQTLGGGVATGSPIVSHSGGYPINTTQVVTSGWTAGVNGILLAGDVIKFAGHATLYYVLYDVNSFIVAGAATISIAPGLTSSVANGEAITVQTSPLNGPTAQTKFTNPVRLHLKRLDTNAEGNFRIGGLTTKQIQGAENSFAQHFLAATALTVQPLRYPIGVATPASGQQANGAASVGATSIPTKGWTASITGILKQGDVISFAGHGQRYFVTADTNSDGGGLSTVVINPALVSAVANNEAVSFQTSPGKLPLPPNGISVEFSLFLNSPTADTNALLINDVHPVQLWKDLLDGYFGYLWNDDDLVLGNLLPPTVNLGDPKRKIPYNGSAFAALIADATIPTFRAVIDKAQPLNDFIEKFICKPYGLGYYLNGSGQVVPVDLRHPTSPLSIATITDDDIDQNQNLGWEIDSTATVNSAQGTRYIELFFQPSQVGPLTFQQLFKAIVTRDPSIFGYPQITASMLQGAPITSILPGLGRSEILDDQPFTVDAIGLRSQPRETIALGTNQTPQDRGVWADNVLLDLMRYPQRMFGRGSVIARIRCQRTAFTIDCFPGSLKFLGISALPDPASNLRGGTRLVRCIERSENGQTIDFVFLDLGISQQATPPTFGTPALVTLAGWFGAGPLHEVVLPIVLNGQNQPAQIAYALTTTSVGTRPVDTDGAWTPIAPTYQSQTVGIRILPAGRRIWLRARTFDQSGVQQPSAWAYPSPDHLDLTALPAPTSISVSNIQAASALVSWVPADMTLAHRIYLVTPTSDPLQFVVALLPGTTNWTLSNLTASTQYKVEVRSTDGHAGESSGTNTTFTTLASGSALTCPAPGNISISIGG